MRKCRGDEVWQNFMAIFFLFDSEKKAKSFLLPLKFMIWFCSDFCSVLISYLWPNSRKKT